MAANHREAKSGTSGDGFGGQELNTFAPSVNEMRVYRENKDTHGNPQFILFRAKGWLWNSERPQKAAIITSSLVINTSRTSKNKLVNLFIFLCLYYVFSKEPIECICPLNLCYAIKSP